MSGPFRIVQRHESHNGSSFQDLKSPYMVPIKSNVMRNVCRGMDLPRRDTDRWLWTSCDMHLTCTLRRMLPTVRASRFPLDIMVTNALYRRKIRDQIFQKHFPKTVRGVSVMGAVGVPREVVIDVSECCRTEAYDDP